MNISLTPSVKEALSHGYHLNNEELLATLFGKKASGLLLSAFSSFHEMANAGVEELKKVKGIGEKKAIQVKAIVEFSRRLYQKPLEKGAKFTSSFAVFQAYAPLLKGRLQESFWVVLLNNRNQVIKHVQISEGCLASCPVDPRAVFNQAVREGACCLICLHNHPSGDCEPSQEDRELTGRLQKAGELLGVKVLDHLVIAEDSYVSFADRGMI
jgi:DNA repair protein RadC